MSGLKIAIIGAGSTYTPELFDGFIKRKDVLDVDSFYLMDINMPKMKIVGSLVERMVEKAQLNASVIMTNDLKEAITGADFVMSQVRVGMLDARILDEKIPLKYDLIGQETTGVGGFMKALRTIPVIMNVAENIKKYAPGAWLINFANPSGIVAEAIQNYTDIKMIGLCNGPVGMKKNAMTFAPEDAKHVVLNYIGLNHLAWVTDVYCDGIEIMQDKLKDYPNLFPINGVLGRDIDVPLIEHIRSIPSGYLAYYYYRDEMLAKLKKQEQSRGEVCKEIEGKLLELYKDTELNEKPEILNKRGGAMYSEVAVSLVDAICNDKNDLHTINIKNNGTLDFMSNDDIIEVNCTVGKNGPSPIKPYKFNNQHVIDMMQVVKSYEKKTAKAAISGDYRMALDALLVHPLIGDYTRAKGVLDDMLKANQEFLPQFYD